MAYLLPCSSCNSFVPVETNQAGRQVRCTCGEMLQIPSLSQITKLEFQVVAAPVAASSSGAKKQKVRKNRPISLKYLLLGFAIILLFEILVFGFWFLWRYQFPVSALLYIWQFPHFCRYLVSVTGIFAILATAWFFILKARSHQLGTKHFVLGIGIQAFWITALLFVLALVSYPQLYEVCTTNPYYVHGDKVIGRDSLPIPPRDRRLLINEHIRVVWSEDIINDSSFIDQDPILLIEMHDNFKGGLELSYNFNEKYEKLAFIFWAKVIVFGVLMVASLAVAVVGALLPGQTEEIGERGGESWE